jgi:hypothetical protein
MAAALADRGGAVAVVCRGAISGVGVMCYLRLSIEIAALALVHLLVTKP